MTSCLRKQAIKHNQFFTSLQCGFLLKTFTNRKSLPEGRILHAHMTISNILLDNTYLTTKLTAFYANCNQMEEAHYLFNSIENKNNSFLWNSMIRGYSCSNSGAEALRFYGRMMEFGLKADNFTYPFVIKACNEENLAEMGRRIHCEVVINGLVLDTYVSNSLIAMYCDFGAVELARKLFDGMPDRDLTSWNTIIMGHVNNRDPSEGLMVLAAMRGNGFVPDGNTLLGVVSGCGQLGLVNLGKEVHGYVVRMNNLHCDNFVMNSLIEMYFNCCSPLYAKRLFESKMDKDIVSWNSTIWGFTKNGDSFESLRVFCRMVFGGTRLDQVTLMATLEACEQITALQFGMSLHSRIVRTGFGASTLVGTSLVDMYSKCGSLPCSRLAFDEISNRSLVSWSAMIAGYGVHGQGKEALRIFHEMISNNVVPDDGVFTSVLSACSHAGLVEEGKEIFYGMKREYNHEPRHDHYSSLVDLLGRSGRLEEAYQVIKSMEIKPNEDIWSTLLYACRLHRNVWLAEIAAQEVLHLNPDRVSTYVCISNIYAGKRMWNNAETVRSHARRKGLKKLPGCSFIEFDRVIHRFLVGDKSHPQTESIYCKLKDLKHQLEEAGYRVDTSSVLFDVEEEVKETMIWYHSERLAIAFALINTKPGVVIRITKNLRVCTDCHTVTKLISKLTNREIIMRDIHRFHHFKDGVCSCSDYW